MNAKTLSKELESLGFRLSLGATEIDGHLTEQEIELLETIAVRYAGRRAIDPTVPKNWKTPLLIVEKGPIRQ